MELYSTRWFSQKSTAPIYQFLQRVVTIFTIYCGSQIRAPYRNCPALIQPYHCKLTVSIEPACITYAESPGLSQPGYCKLMVRTRGTLITMLQSHGSGLSLYVFGLMSGTAPPEKRRNRSILGPDWGLVLLITLFFNSETLS